MTDRSRGRGPADGPAGVPTGRAVRRWTRARALRRDRAGLADLLSDVYMAVLTVVLSAATSLSAAARLGADLTGTAPPGGPGLAPGWLGVLAGAGVLAGLLALVLRLGPVALGGPQAEWWLPLPVGRRGLLRPPALRWPAIAGLVGAVVGLAVSLLLDPRPAVPVLLGAGLTGGGVAVAGVLAATLAETSPVRHRRARVGADLCLAAVPVLGLVVAAAGVPPPVLRPGDTVAAAVAVLAVAVVLAAVADARLARIPGTVLRRGGAVSGEALGAALSLDTRALGQALAVTGGPAERRRSVRVRRLGSVPLAARAPAVLLTADALALARSPRHLVQLVVGAALPCLAVAVASPVPVVTVALLVVGAWVAALATAGPARLAQASPALDALLPLDQRRVRRLRLVVPAAVMVAWFTAVLGAVGLRAGGGGWVVLGVCAGPVLAAAAQRSAYRPPPDFSGPLVHTPMGAYPPGLATVATKGPDVAAVGSVPLAVAVLTGAVGPVLLLAQAVLAVAAVALAVRTEPQPARSSAPARSS